MKKGSIQHLNSLWWYRLVKVLHILFWSLVALGTFAGTLSGMLYEQATVDLDNSMIECSTGNGKSFNFRYLEIESAVERSYWSEYSATNQELLRIEFACEKGVKQSQIMEKSTKKNLVNLFIPTANAQLISSYDTYDFRSSVERKTTLTQKLLSLGAATLALLAVILVEYLLRHTFYYVVLGKFTPPKK